MQCKHKRMKKNFSNELSEGGKKMEKLTNMTWVLYLAYSCKDENSTELHCNKPMVPLDSHDNDLYFSSDSHI